MPLRLSKPMEPRDASANAQEVVEAAVADLTGFGADKVYDFGNISDDTTVPDWDFGSIADLTPRLLKTTKNFRT